MPLLPFIPYPPAKDGYWGPVTSTLNWCEEDYYATKYSAEIVNALTNLLFMLLGVKGILSCRRNGHDIIFEVAYYGYVLVGTGSFLFHSTLKYPMQLVDELSMIYTTCLMCYASFSHAKPTGYRISLAISLTALAVFITLYHHYLQNPVFHQTAYAILTAIVVLRGIYTMEVRLRPSTGYLTEEGPLAREKQSLHVLFNKQQHYENVREMTTLKKMWLIVGLGLSMFLGGFGIWNLDNYYCGIIRVWRRELGLPWGIMLEGHGWWHLMTGTGAYLYIVWGIWLRHCLNKRQEEYHLWWPHFWNIPEIVRTQITANVSAKKSN